MKLRNLLIALTTVGTFMACTNNDDPIAPVIPEGEGIATLSVKIAELQTKSLGIEDGSTNETIKDLCVLIFKGTGENAKLEKIGRVEVSTGSVTEVENIPITSGNKKIIVLANVNDYLSVLTEGENGTSYHDVLEKTYLTFSEKEQNGTLSMNSKVYDVTLSVSKKNYLGYIDKTDTEDEAVVAVASGDAKTPVKLYRNVAQVTLDNISFEPNLGLYKNAKLILHDIFILHGQEHTHLVGAEGAEWGSTCLTNAYLNGATNDDYLAWVNKMTSPGKVKAFNYIKSYYSPYLGKENTYRDSYPEPGIPLISVGDWKNEYSRKFYVYENENVEPGDTHTLLVVKADFLYENEGGTVTMSDRYYTIAVGVTGLENGYTLGADDSMNGLTRNGESTFYGVLRNLSYKVSMTIAGPGSETPFDREYSANISASVKVNEWNVVKVPAEVN